MKTVAARLFTDYGMLLVLLLLCACFSALTMRPQSPSGVEGGRILAENLKREFSAGASVLVVASSGPDDRRFTAELANQLAESGLAIVDIINGGPQDVRGVLEDLAQRNAKLDAIACNKVAANWSVLADPGARFPNLANAKVVIPPSHVFPDFLKTTNLSNIAGQSAVFAIIAIGMTMVIITAGIDLSVGSLVALSAVTTAILIRDYFGGPEAKFVGMAASGCGGIAICGAVGLFAGFMITQFGIPPFVVTLAMMSVGRGLAQIMSAGQSVYQVPGSFSKFATGDSLGIPNSVALMIVLYVVAHIVMAHTTLGRYIYAVGGNREAARLSGVPVRQVLLAVYAASGALAGLGGVIEASRLGSGSPLYGQMYELDVIASVVVGGTSLAGGEGKVFSTLIGALIIAVIRNGMNLMNIESYTQGVVMGMLILAAVLIDALKKKRI